MKMLTRTLLIAAALVASATFATAQTYQSLGNGVVIGSDGSMAQPLGNGVIITQTPPFPQYGQPLQPQRQVYCQPLGYTVVCN